MQHFVLYTHDQADKGGLMMQLHPHRRSRVDITIPLPHPTTLHSHLYSIIYTPLSPPHALLHVPNHDGPGHFDVSEYIVRRPHNIAPFVFPVD